MAESIDDRCGRCGAEIDPNRRVDFTLKDGTKVCDSCFVKGTKSQLVPEAIRLEVRSEAQVPPVIPPYRF